MIRCSCIRGPAGERPGALLRCVPFIGLLPAQRRRGGHPEVLQTLQEFHAVVLTRQGQLANDKLVSLLKALCQDVGINPASVNDSFYLQPFNITARSSQVLGGKDVGFLSRRPRGALHEYTAASS